MDINQFNNETANNTDAIKQCVPDEATPRVAKAEQREAKPSDTAENAQENVKSKKSGIPDEGKLFMISMAHMKHTQELEGAWRASIELAEKVNKETGRGESKLGCMLHAYTAFVKSVSAATIEMLEKHKLLTVTTDREQLVTELATSPMFLAGSTSMIADMIKNRGK